MILPRFAADHVRHDERHWQLATWIHAVVAVVLVCAATVFSLPPKAQRDAAAPPPPAPVEGRLDASAWNFAHSGAIRLDGDWLFSSGAKASSAPPVYYPVPGYWSDLPGNVRRSGGAGYGNYFLRVHLPKAPPGEHFAVETGYWLSAYRMYVNGELVLASGTPSPRADAEVTNAYSKLVSLPDHLEEFELRFEVSNHINLHGGSFVAPRLGLDSALQRETNVMRAVTMFLVGAMFFAALYHLVLYLLDRSASANLWFACFATLLCTRTLTIAPMAVFTQSLIGQDWVWRVDFAASVLLLPACYQFFLRSFPRYMSSWPAPWLWIVFSGWALAALVFGPATGEYGMKVVEAFALPYIAYLCFSLGRAALQREEGAALALVGWLLCASASVHDILVDNLIITGIDLIPFGFLAFFLCIAGMLAGRFQSAFRQARHLTLQLRELNEKLESAVQKRTSELRDKLDELKSNQAELVRAREAAVSANTAKSRFLATMSHELRTPLNSILGFSEIIRDERLGSLGDQRYGEYAAYINESGAHLLSLIGDILDLSRIESGKMDLQFETVSIEEMADAAMRRAATRERKAGECVSISLPSGLPQLSADRRALLQMLINLISNALKFTPVDGKITVSAFMRGDGGMTLQVKDTGIGMAPEDIPRALMAFTQVDDDLSRRHEGSGLGLTIVKSMMEQHGGRLTLQSAKGEGTTVSLEFPAARVVPAQAVVARETARAG